VRQYQSAYADEIVVRELEVAAYLFGVFGTAFLLSLHGIPVVKLS